MTEKNKQMKGTHNKNKDDLDGRLTDHEKDAQVV